MDKTGEMRELFNELKTATNQVIELNKKLFELCSRLNDVIEKEEEKN